MLVQTREAASLTGIPTWQIQSYAKQGFVTAAVSPKGAGTRRSYDIIGLVKLAVLKRLTDDGFDLRTIRPIFSGLFEIPLQPGSGTPPEERVRAWFADKILITARQFSVRKLVRRDRSAEAIAEMLPRLGGLYIVDLGGMIDALLNNLISLTYDTVGETAR